MDRSLSIRLALLGIFVSAAFGLASWLPALQGAGWQIKLTIASLCALVFTLFWCVIWLVNAPSWSIVTATYSLEFTDPKGLGGSLKKTLILRSNRRARQEYTHRGIKSDGDLEIELEPGLTEVGSVNSFRGRAVRVRLPTPVGFLQTHQHWIRVDFPNAFLNDRELWCIRVDSPIRRLDVTVTFPDDRQPEEVHLVYTRGQINRRLELLNQNGKIVTWTHARPFRNVPHGDYELTWRW